MRKLVLICILAIGVSFGNNASQAIKENCGNVPLSQCIDFYKKQCNAGKMIHCGFAGDILYARHDIYEARRYYKMACDKIDLNNSIDTIKAADGQIFKADLQGKKNAKAKFCYNFVITTKDLYLEYPRKLTKQDEQDAINAMKTACNLGHSVTCKALREAEQIAKRRRR